MVRRSLIGMMMALGLVGLPVGSTSAHATEAAVPTERGLLPDAVSTEAGTLGVIGLGLLSLVLIRRRVSS